MTELVKDLKYLARMRQLETSGERVLDVVPVSGLVLSQFYRLENELKTVIDQLRDLPAPQDENLFMARIGPTQGRRDARVWRHELHHAAGDGRLL